MKKFAIQAVALVVVIFVALILSTNKVPLPFTPQPLQTKQLQIKNVLLTVDVADTQQKRSQGLSGRDSLASDAGMLFVFDKFERVPFWMKGMKFAIDFIYIRQNKVVDFIKNAEPPKPNTSDQELPLYLPNQPIDSILEVNSGFVDQHNIQLGDNILLK